MNNESTIPSQLGPMNTMPASLRQMESAEPAVTPSDSGALFKLVLVALVIALVVFLAR